MSDTPWMGGGVSPLGAGVGAALGVGSPLGAGVGAEVGVESPLDADGGTSSLGWSHLYARVSCFSVEHFTACLQR